MKTIYILAIAALVVSCSKVEDVNGINDKKVIDAIKAMSKLGTSEYTLSKVLAGEDSQWYTIGSRKIIIQCKAYLTTGIDAGQIQFTDVNPKEKKIKLTLPPVEILTLNIPPNEIKTISLDVGFFRDNYSSKERQQFETIAEGKIKEQVKELKIVAETEKNAKIFLESILRSSGFVSIEIQSSPSAM